MVEEPSAWMVTAAVAAQDVHYRVDFSLEADSGRGHTAKLEITNTGFNPIQGWRLEFDFEYDIDRLWAGHLESHIADRNSVLDDSWNAIIQPGATASFNWKGSPGYVAHEPSRFLLNGVPPENDCAAFTYTVLGSWPNGFKAEISIENRTDEAMRDWTITFDFDARIGAHWNGRIAYTSGNYYEVEALSWNDLVPRADK